MLEGLKELLGMLEHVAGLSLWVLLGYVIYMLVIYLSTAGSIVYCTKLIVDKLHDAHQNRVNSKLELEKERLENERRPTEWSIDGILVSDKTRQRLTILLNSVREHTNRKSNYHHGYLHDSDVEWIEKAIIAYRESEKET